MLADIPFFSILNPKAGLWVCRPGMDRMRIKLSSCYIISETINNCVSFPLGHVHQIYLRWTTCHHWNHRTCKYDKMFKARVHSLVFHAGIFLTTQWKKLVVSSVGAVGHLRFYPSNVFLEVLLIPVVVATFLWNNILLYLVEKKHHTSHSLSTSLFVEDTDTERSPTFLHSEWLTHRGDSRCRVIMPLVLTCKSAPVITSQSCLTSVCHGKQLMLIFIHVGIALYFSSQFEFEDLMVR